MFWSFRFAFHEGFIRVEFKSIGVKLLHQTTLIIGGCRSGKSRYALTLAEQTDQNQRTFIATSVPEDDEMKDRVRRHQEERGPGWKTLEVPIRLAQAISENCPAAGVIVVDCITLWLSNLMRDADTEYGIEDHIDRLSASLAAVQCPVILVTNEVGTGIVPDNRLARRFRDLVGTANQKLACVSDRVVWVVAGIPVFIKGESNRSG